MQCPYCAEVIQDAAVVCRFCGAARGHEGWMPPPPVARAVGGWPVDAARAGSAASAFTPGVTPAGSRRGVFTFRTSGVLLLLSGVFALLSLTRPEPLFGAMRGGAVALGYHLLFGGLFLAVGWGLIVGRLWGYKLFMFTTLLYTVDKLLFLLDRPTREAYLAGSGLPPETSMLIEPGLLDQAVMLTTLAILLGWWSFALYVYLRRGYFQDGPSVLAERTHPRPA